MPAGEIPKKAVQQQVIGRCKDSDSQKQHAQQRTFLVNLQLKSGNRVGIDAFYSVYL